MAMCTTLMASATAGAVPSPHLHWHTLRTECCDIHTPKELLPLARRVEGMVDECVRNVEDLLGTKISERVQVVLGDNTDSANGFANIVPYNRVELRAITPDDDSELGAHDDWMRLLVQHEIFHVVHLDVVHGVPAVVNLAFGKLWPPNVVQPRLFIEGLATWAETRFTDRGRLRSSLFLLPMRIAALQGDLWSLDDAVNASRRPPGAAAAYVYGAAFMEWLAQRYGPEIWAPYTHDYGGTIIPYGVQRALEAVTGHDLADDWEAFLDDLRADARALRTAVTARGGPTAARRLTRVGGVIRSPTFASDGSLLFSADPPDGPAGIWRLRASAQAPEPIVRTSEAADIVDVDGILVLTQVERHRAFWTFRDVFALGNDGGLRPLSDGARLRHPARIPGTSAVVLEHRTGTEAALVRFDTKTGIQEDIIRADDGTVFYTPVVSPDGRHVTVSRFSPGGARDLVEIDLADATWRNLTRDGRDDFDPAYTLDGRYVLFSSDRDGTFNIYAVDRSSLEVRRITDTLGGAFQPTPTPDGRGVIYIDSHLDGSDLYAAALDPAHAPRAPEPLPPPSSPAALRETPSLSAGPSTTAMPVEKTPMNAVSVPEPYNPFATLAPRRWRPLLQTDALGGTALGAAVDGEDAVGAASFSAAATWGLAVEAPSVAAGLRLNDLWLPLSLAADFGPFVSDGQRLNNGVPELQRDDVVRASLAVGVPLSRARFAHALALSVTRQVSFDRTGFTSAPDGQAPVYPGSVTAPSQTFVSLSWSYSGQEQYRDSISPERGMTTSMRLRLASKELLSDLDVREFTVDTRTFQPVLGLNNHVVALLISGGVALDDRPGGAFLLGGFAGRDLLDDLVSGARAGFGALRGYPALTAAGDAFVLSTLEYRFPWLEIERGIETLPAYVERVSGAIFADVGSAFMLTPRLDQWRVGVGAELRLEIILGYYGSYFVRAGYARGTTSGGIDQPYVLMGAPF